MEQDPTRIDLHVHSKFSTRPSQWILQKLGCPESFTEPHEIYHIAKTRGMTLVTITDHNRIEGALEIAHLPDAFVSEEITTYFPENRCKIHVLALNIDEAQHRDIQKARENIYELVDYLLEAGIFHILAHPLFSVNGRLTVTHLEKLLLLFKNFEMNGARNDQTNECLQHILRQLTPADIDRLADDHGIAPRMEAPWRKNITGGSDDHSSLNIARTHTEIPNADTLADALAGILDNRARVVRHPSTPLGFARNIYSIGYQFYRHRLHLERYTSKDLLLNFLDRCLLQGSVHSGPGFMVKLYDLWHYRKRPRLKTRMPRFESGLHLIVTGAGSMTAGLRRLVGTAPCTFIERPTEEEWPGICASSDIFVSRGRGQDAVKAVSEAQASGVPVIVEDLNQLKGCISPERSGIVVRSKDADSLNEALQRLISSEDSRRRMGRSARQFAESSATVWTAFADPNGANPSQEFASPARLAGVM